MNHLLILGGTTEARILCDVVATIPVQTTVSLAGATTKPTKLATHTRSGGFGGTKGLITWLRDHRATALIDATHPFAFQMPWHAHEACETLGLPRLRLLRPAFAVSGSIRHVDDLAHAVREIPSRARVLATTGHKETQHFCTRPDLTVFLRTIEPATDLPTNVTALQMRPPFKLTDEQALFRQHAIDVLIAKDSGGVTEPKLAAAGALGIPSLLIRRPMQPPGPTVQTADQAVAWLRHVVGIGS